MRGQTRSSQGADLIAQTSLFKARTPPYVVESDADAQRENVVARLVLGPWLQPVNLAKLTPMPRVHTGITGLSICSFLVKLNLTKFLNIIVLVDTNLLLCLFFCPADSLPDKHDIVGGCGAHLLILFNSGSHLGVEISVSNTEKGRPRGGK